MPAAADLDAILRDGMPSIFDVFNTEIVRMPVERLKVAHARFDLSCKECAGKSFSFLSFPQIAPDPSPYYLIAPGETFYRPPHSAICASCGRKAKVFDGLKDGYDGVLEIGCSHERGKDVDFEAARPGTYTLSVQVVYNIEVDELRQLAAEANVSPADLFDWLTIEGQPHDKGEGFNLGYECA